MREHHLHTLCDVMSNMLDTVDIQVIKRDDFSGIMIEAIDAAQVSLVAAQLRADVVMQDGTDQHCSASTARPSTPASAARSPLLDLHGVAARQLVDPADALSSFKTSITKFTVPTLV